MGRYQEGTETTARVIETNGLDIGLSPHIQRVRPIHRSMAQAFILGNLRPGELAQHYGYSEGQISRIIGSPAFQVECERLRATKEVIELDMAKDIQLMRKKAVEVLDNDLEMDPLTLDHRKVRQNVALKILGLDGKGIQVQFNQLNTGRTRPPEDLDESAIRDEILELTKGPSGDYAAD